MWDRSDHLRQNIHTPYAARSQKEISTQNSFLNAIQQASRKSQIKTLKCCSFSQTDEKLSNRSDTHQLMEKKFTKSWLKDNLKLLHLAEFAKQEVLATVIKEVVL